VIGMLPSPHYLAAATGSANCADGGTCPTDLPVVTAGSGELQQLLTIIFGVFAAVSVLMIVIAGFRFISAQGNASEIAKARSTIIYAIAGLLVSLIAEAIVGFVLGKL
jgi:type IV secretion system pilin